ncbi:MAG TPA: ABC transporter ATP-binding protein [Chryseosolibacter sp.]|nr:ABC transporter ATP-binding protein [Chryseosolibacter sp.]
MNNSTHYITTHQLAVGYQQKGRENRLFDNLNLTVDGGSMICFMGPNGAGKSSLLRTLAGLQQPLAGKVTLRTTETGTVMEHQIAVVLTDRVSAGNLTVEEVVTFGRYPYLGWNIRLQEHDKEIIRNAIERVHITSLIGRRLYELSDGQTQMVMIARALAQDTPIILLDEPTAHLDLNNRVEMMNLLRQLSRTTGKAILLATHELDLALQTADVIWLTGNNRDILTGMPEDLVLNGSFDEIFRFKGFDLKTGKVLHQAFRNMNISLKGDGAEYLWTKNALERNGYSVVPGINAEISITLVQEFSRTLWIIRKNSSEIEVDSLKRLIECL